MGTDTLPEEWAMMYAGKAMEIQGFPDHPQKVEAQKRTSLAELPSVGDHPQAPEIAGSLGQEGSALRLPLFWCYEGSSAFS